MTHTALPSPARGRPKDGDKRDAILKAARAMFFANGFEAVALEGVAKSAGVARMTIYSHFHDKETLFTAVVQGEAARLSAALTSISPSGMDLEADGATRLRGDLTEFGVALLSFLSDPETKAFNRLVETQSRHMPELAKAFVRSGPRAVMARLADRLATAAHHGVAQIDDPARAACQFIGMLRSIEALATLSNWTERPDEKAIRFHVADSVERFIRAFR